MNKIRNNKLAKAVIILIIMVFFINSTSAFAVADQIYSQHQEESKWKEIFNADLNEGSSNLDELSSQEEENPNINTKDSILKEMDTTFSLEKAQSEYTSSRFIIKYKDEPVPDKHNKLNEEAGFGKLQLEAKETALKDNIRQRLNGKHQVRVKNRDTGEEEIALLTLTNVEALAEDAAIVELEEEITTEQLMQELDDNTIDYIQPDYPMMAAGIDPLLSEQWGHSQFYQPEDPELNSYRMDANVIEAWPTAQGAGALVAIIDGGIDIGHPDLMDSIWHNPNEMLNGLDDDGNGYIDDICGWDFFNDDNNVNDVDNKNDQWHSTHIAGIIAAQKDNSIGIAGVAPGAKILPLKVFEGGVAYTSDIIRAIEYAEQMGAAIANCSWGSLYENPALKEVIENSSMLFVCAAGNSVFDLDKYPVYPACFGLSNIISVTSIDQDGRFSRFANYGANSIDIAAPGQEILSTWINNDYQATSGTSMSAGYVSGAAALLTGQNPGMSASQIKERLIDSGDSITGLQGKVKGGKKLNCTYAVSNNTAPNSTIIDISDSEPLPIITPTGPVEDDNYEQYGADGYVGIRAPLPVARHGLQLVALGDYVYAIGGMTGSSSGYTNRVDRYDPKTDTWTQMANMQTARAYFGAVAWNNKIYVFGGYTSSVEIYTPNSGQGTWANATTSMPAAIGNFSTTFVPANSPINGTSARVFVIGGETGYLSSVRNTVYEGVLQNGSISWSSKTNITAARAGHTACYNYNNGQIYIECGRDSSGYLQGDMINYNVQTYMPSFLGGSNVWAIETSPVVTNERFIVIGGRFPWYHHSSNIRNLNMYGLFVSNNHMGIARSGLGSAILGGKVYMVGGRNGSTVLDYMEVMDLGWEEKAPLPVALKNFKTVESNGKLYAMGGRKLVSGSEEISKAVYEYDPVDNKWISKADMPYYCQNFALASAYGKIYLIGGLIPTTPAGLSFYLTNQVYEYSPATNVWTQKANLPNSRFLLEACFFKGKIYAIGGLDSSSSACNKVDLYDPLTNSWISGPNISVGGQAINIGTPYTFTSQDKVFVFDKNASSAYIFNGTSWQSVTPLGSHSNTYVTLNDGLYAIGHQSSNYAMPSIFKYSSLENMWTTYSTFNFFGQINVLGTLNNGAYIFTGINDFCTGMVKYSPKISPWTHKSSIWDNAMHIGAANIGDIVYAAGGHSIVNGTSTLIYHKTLYEYSQSNDLWDKKNDMTYPRAGLALTAAKVGASDRLYAIGGQNSGAIALSYVEEYNPSATSYPWTIKTALPAARSYMASAVYNNKIYIFGGKNTSGSPMNTVYIYDPNAASNPWTTLSNASMPYAVYGCGAAVIGNKIYVVGGYRSANDYTPFNMIQIFDPAGSSGQGSWETRIIDNLSQTGLSGIAYAGVAGKDNLYIVGGTDGYNVNSFVYEYSPSANQWFAWQGPDRSRLALGAALTSKGLYAIAGVGDVSTNSNPYGWSMIWNDVEFASLSELETANDYLHMGEDFINPSGNFSRTYTDMEYTTPGFNIAFSRTYNSRDQRTSNLISPGWTFGFQGKIDTDGNDLIVNLPNGSALSFRVNTTTNPVTYTAKDSRSKLVKNTDNTYTMTTADQYQYHFNTNKYMDWMADRNSNKINLTVDSSGKVSSVMDQAGQTSYIYYNGNQISYITDPAGRRVDYYYNSGRLSQVTDPMGNSTYYEYVSRTVGGSTKYFLSKIKDSSQTTLEMVDYNDPTTYEPLPQVKTITYGVTAAADTGGSTAKRVESYTYDKSEGSVTIKDNDSPARTTVTWYDKMLYPIRSLDAEGRQTYLEYNLDGGLNRYGEVKRQTDRNGNSTYYERDNQGNVTKVVNPDGSSRTYTYDANNNLTSEKDEIGSATYYVYDTSGNMTKKARRLLGSQDYSPSAIQGNFAITNYVYTNKTTTTSPVRTIYKLLTQEADPEGGITNYTYDNYGNLATASRLRSGSTYNTTTYQYNKLGWLKQETTSKGNITKYCYDKNGRFLKKTMPDTGAERYVYDAFGNLTQKITPNQYSSAYDSAAFDTENILSSVSSAYSQTGHGYRYTYFTSGLLQKETDPLGYTSTYTYDIYANKKTETKPAPGAAPTTSPSGAVYTYTYDALNRLTKLEYKPSSGGSNSKLEEYVYTVLGTGQTTVKESKYFTSSVKADTTFTYDYAGRVVKQVNPDSGIIINEYNPNGTLKQTTDPRDNLTSYQYDALNRPAKQWTPADNSKYSYVELEYDKCDRVITRKESTDLVNSGAAPSVSTNIISTITTYNKDGTISEQEIKQGSTQKGRTVYTYDNDGNMTQERQYTGSSAYNQIDYTYNSMGWPATKKLTVTSTDITPSTTSLTTSYTYDKQGNVLTVTDPNNINTTYTYNLINSQLTTSQPGLTDTGASTTITSSKTYDWAGNVLTQTDPNSKTTGYTFDARGFLTKITDPLAGVTAYEYDFAGRKTKEISPKNYATNQSNRTAFAYDGMGRLISQTEYFDSSIIVNSFTYDKNGNMLTKKDGKNYTTTYTYTAGNQLATVKDPVTADKGLSFSSKYEYDGLGRKTKETNADNIASQYTYDALNNLLTIMINNRLVETNTYDYLGNLLTTKDANSKTTTMTYNALNQVRRITYPSDSNIGSYYVDYKYNKLGLVAEALDSMSPYKKIVTTYNNQGQVLSQTESTSAGAQAITVSKRYDKGGNLRFAVDGRGNETEYVYDALNRKTQEKVKVTVNGSLTTQTTSYAYDANSNLLSVTDWRNNIVQNVYDPLNRLIQRKDANNTVIETLTYDANHQQITSKDGNNHTTTFVYDKNNRLIEKYNYLNEAQSGTKISEKQEYDNLGRVVNKKDGKNNTTQYNYDAWGNLAWVKDATAKQTDFAYDYNGNLISQTDPSGNITQFAYNARNLLQSKTDALGNNEYYIYNANGTISSQTDRNGVQTGYTYDIHGRLLTESKGGVSISHTYDNNGNELTMLDSTGTTTRTYDQSNRVVSKAVPNIGTTTFKYDEITALPNGSSLPTGYRKEVSTDPKSNVTTKVTDKNGRLVQVFDGSTLVATYAYQNNGNRASVTYASGVKEEYTYNDNNLLKTLTNKNNGGATIEAFNYGYDLAGNMTSKLDKKGTTSYTYDADNRLATVTEPGSKVTTYTFDNAGNRATEAVQQSSTTTTTSYNYDANNRLLGTQTSEGQSIIGSDEYTYDKNGNMLSRISLEGSSPNTTPALSLEILGEEVGSGTSALYSYDVFNNMIGVLEGNQRIESKYNGNGQRVEKTVNGTTTRYLYEYDQVILEVNGSSTQTGRNIYGLNLLRRKEGVTNLDYLYNGHGDVTNLMNGTTIAATYYYDAFGVCTETTYSGGMVSTDDTNPYRYAGYRYDSETQLYYLNSRMYNPNLARFMQEDTYRGTQYDPLSLNLYTYCFNNPITYIDPAGHAPTKTYVEGGITYTNVDGKIYKDGRLISESSYSYIPTAIGGTRDGTPSSSSPSSSSSSSSSSTPSSNSPPSPSSSSSSTTSYSMNSNGSIIKTVNGVNYVVGVNDERYPRLINELNSYIGSQGNQNLRTVVGDTIQKGQVNWISDGKPVTITQGDRLVATLNYNSKTGTYATDNSSIVTKMNSGRLVIQNKDSNNVSAKPNSTTEGQTVNSVGAVWPVEYFDNMYISSPFGQRSSGFHTGIDIAGQGVRGQDIYASYGGVVKEVKLTSGGYGQYVVIESTINGETVCILYAHMIKDSQTVKIGDSVEAGQTIGNVGNTGNVTGNHLHFEIRPGSYSDFWSNKPVDPVPYLPDMPKK